MRKIAIATGSRAEYGLLFNLIKEIDRADDLELQLIVLGMHLEARFGHTLDQIEADGFDISARIPMEITDDSAEVICQAIGHGVTRMAEALKNLAPDILVVLGDRYEIFAAAQAAMVMQIPIAHIHGGEASEGLIDEAIRHALTKMSHLHFAAAQPYGDRIIQMGEDPRRVFVTGAPALDNIRNLAPLENVELEKLIGFKPASPLFLVTYHPVTLAQSKMGRDAQRMLSALDEFPEARIVFTGVNSDPNNAGIRQAIEAYVEANSDRCHFSESLGTRGYLSLMAKADAVIGNSSSGIIEAPMMRVPTVNIGPRQNGRLRSASIIDCADRETEIQAAIALALSPEFRVSLEHMTPAYGIGQSAPKICRILREIDLEGILYKQFFDLPIDLRSDEH